MLYKLKLTVLLVFFYNLSYSQFVLNGSATNQGGGEFRLTPALGNRVGSIWYEDKISLNEPFELNFELFFGNNNGGADGMTFCLQPLNTSIGVPGGGLGVQGVQPSLFVEFDTWSNSGDPSFDHLAIQRNGNVAHTFPNMLSAPTRIRNGVDNVEDGQWYPVRVTWDPNARVFMVFVDCQMRSMYIGDIVNDIFNGDPMVFWGFTASTGGAVNIHSVRNINTNLISIPDQLICRNGSIQVNIPPTSSNFTWSPTTGINNLTSLTPIFSPTQTTEYVISYEGLCNTFVRDTFLVEVGLDSDKDRICDFEDLDDDNDGILDVHECMISDFKWSAPPTVNGRTANGVINGINYTYTSSINIQTTPTIFSFGTFPSSYNVPNTTVIRNDFISNNKITFSTPVLNPTLLFSSIGGGNAVPIEFSNPVEVLFQSGPVTINSPTRITGHEGYVILRMNGTYSEISFDYLANETYVNFTFGADFATFCDTDGDGVLDYLDLDSDGDGCPDAIEGGMSFRYTDLNSETRLLGGVDNNGVPIVVNGGQNIGTSNNNLLLDDLCIICNAPDKGEIGSNQSICSGEIPSLLTSINNGNGVIFEWQFSDNNGISWTTINNEDKSTYKPSSELTNTRWYRRRGRKDCTPIEWSNWSDHIIVTVNPIPSIIDLNDVSGSVCGVGSALLGVSGVSSNNTIDWYDSNINGNILFTGSINFNTPDISENRNYFAQLRDLSTGCINKNRIKVEAIFHEIPVFNLGNDTSICVDKDITIGVNDIFNNYFWNNGSTSNSIVVSESGKYILSVVDGNWCQSSDTILINVNPLPVFSLGNDTSICVDKDITLGVEPIFNKYLWNTGSVSNKITINQEGNYKLTVTDVNGCVNNDEINLSINPLPVFNLGNDTSICIDKDITFGVGNDFIKYLWNTGSISNKITVNQEGVYKLTITDVNGCVNKDSINLSINQLPVFSLGNDTSICVDKDITFGVEPIFNQYLWNTGSISNKITVNQEGVYKLTVTDVNGCVNKDSINLSINPLPVFSLGNDTSICVDKNITLGIDPIFSKYLWNTGSVSNKITVNQEGVYKLTVTDINGCINSDEINLSINPLPVFNLGNDTSICVDKNITLGIDPIFNKYLWNTGSTSNKITTSNSGKYTLTVTDVNGCVNKDSINLSINPLPVFSLGNDTSICIDKNITLGIDPIFNKYLWNTGSTSNKITTSNGGKYTLTVTDINGCVNKDSINLSINPLPVFNLGNDTSICVDKDITFGVEPIFNQYLWNTGSTSNKITTSNGGKYTLTVTDINGCINSDEINLSINPLPVFNLGNDTSICVDKDITFGVEPIFSKYLWNTGSISNKITVNKEDKYTLTVTDINGCVNKDSINLSTNPLPVFNLGNDTSICIDKNITLGIDPIFSKYSWNTGSTSNKITVNQQGVYKLTVTDINGCISSESISVSINPLPVFNLGNDTSICVDKNITLGIDPIFNKYLWNTGSTSNKITTSNGGKYTLTVTDINGCVSSESISVFINPLPVFNLGNDTSICVDKNITLGIDPIFSKYLWNTGSTSNKITTSNGSKYTLTVTDINGCVNKDSINLSINPLPVFNLGNDTSICTYQNITFGVEPIYSKYLWNTGSTSNKITTSTSGKYKLTVTDNNGCINSNSISLSIDELDFNIKDEYNICEGEEAELRVDIIKNIDKIVWNNTTISNTYKTNKEGIHFVKAISKKGCELEKNSLVNITKLPLIDFDRTIELCDESKVDVSIDTKQYDIIWYDGLRSNKRTIRKDGIFRFELINKNDKISCSVNDSVNIKFNFSPEIIDISDQYFCFDEKDKLLLEIPSKANFYYLGLDNRNIYDTNIIPIFSEGVYNISFFNSYGCESTQEVKVINECEFRLFIPNSFTPNGDGLNDFFKITSEDVDQYELYIYNRWGEMIFKTNDINEGWNGKINGDPVKTDVYIYLIRLKYSKDGKNISKEYTGHITIYK